MKKEKTINVIKTVLSHVLVQMMFDDPFKWRFHKESFCHSFSLAHTNRIPVYGFSPRDLNPILIVLICDSVFADCLKQVIVTTHM